MVYTIEETFTLFLAEQENKKGREKALVLKRQWFEKKKTFFFSFQGNAFQVVELSGAP